MPNLSNPLSSNNSNSIIPSPKTIQFLEKTFHDYIDKIKILNIVLDAETSALKLMDYEKITEILQEKNSILNALNIIELRWAELETEEKFSISTTFKNLFTKSTVFGELIAISKECKEKNELNGILISHLHNHSQQMIAILSGQNIESTNSYQPGVSSPSQPNYLARA
ncbi:MAG: flagellar export chaperone FlgN [Pseudomonadota bacterium]